MDSPTGMQHGLEEVLILIQGVHQEIPEVPPPVQPVYIAPPAPGPATTPATEVQTAGTGPTGGTGTDADRLRSIYKAVGDAQNHKFGEGLPGSKPPDFTKLPSTPGGVAAVTGASGSIGATGARVGGTTGTTGPRVASGTT